MLDKCVPIYVVGFINESNLNYLMWQLNGYIIFEPKKIREGRERGGAAA